MQSKTYPVRAEKSSYPTTAGERCMGGSLQSQSELPNAPDDRVGEEPHGVQVQARQTAPDGVCGRWAWANNQTGEVARFFCGGRNCHRPECARIFHWRRVNLLTCLVDEYALNYFFTLTLDPAHIPIGTDPWVYVASVWNKMRTVVARDNAEFRYAAILEKHKTNDRPHIHGFCNQFIPWEYWKRKWNAAKGGSGVWLEEIRDPGAVTEYVSKAIQVCKYVGKNQVLGVPHHVQRTLWRSINMKAKFELDTGSEWDILKDEVFDCNGQQRMKLRLDRR